MSCNTEYSCPECDREFESEHGLNTHYGHTHEGSIAREVVSCAECGESFETYISFERKYCSNNCRANGEANFGKENHFYGRSHTKETKELLSEKQSGENHPFYGEKRPEVGKKVSSAKMGHKPTYPKARYVDEIGHHVRSNWEERVARVLTSAGVEYEYEAEGFEYGDGSVYYPDFVIGNVVIEVKGPVFESSIEKAKLMKEKTDISYIVVGSEIPCDIHMPMELVDELPEVLEKI